MAPHLERATKGAERQTAFDADYAAREALLPAPLHTLAVGAAAFVRAHGKGVNLSVEGDTAAAAALADALHHTPTDRSIAAVLPAAAASTAGSTGGDMAAATLYAAHPLSLTLATGQGKARVSFRFHPRLGLLTAHGTPAAADQVLQQLHLHLPSSASPASATLTTERAAHGGGGGDDGSRYPDLSTALRARRLQAATATGGMGSTSGVGAAPEATLTSMVTESDDDEAPGVATGAEAVVIDDDASALHPYRPYQWLQWLGGLGPLLTATPRPSQLVLDTLLTRVFAV